MLSEAIHGNRHCLWVLLSAYRTQRVSCTAFAYLLDQAIALELIAVGEAPDQLSLPLPIKGTSAFAGTPRSGQSALSQRRRFGTSGLVGGMYLMGRSSHHARLIRSAIHGGVILMLGADICGGHGADVGGEVGWRLLRG